MPHDRIRNALMDGYSVEDLVTMLMDLGVLTAERVVNDYWSEIMENLDEFDVGE